MAKDYYEILGVSRESTQDQIKIAYHKLAKTWHPDRNHAPEAMKKYQDISEAYQVLTDDRRRREYDLSWGSGGRFDFKIQSDFFKSSDELYREFFGGKTLDESLEDFLNDPMFAELKYADSQKSKKSPHSKQKASDTTCSTQNPLHRSHRSEAPKSNTKDESFVHLDHPEKCLNDMRDVTDDKQHPENNTKHSSSDQTGTSYSFTGSISNMWTKLTSGKSNEVKKEDTKVAKDLGSQPMDIDQDQKSSVSSASTETNVTEDQFLNYLRNLKSKEEIEKIFKAACMRLDELDTPPGSTGREQ